MYSLQLKRNFDWDVPVINFVVVVVVLSRALADILRQQGTVQAQQYEHENIAAIDSSPQENTPVRTSKNHYTPVHAKPNHGRSIPLSGLLEWRSSWVVTGDWICSERCWSLWVLTSLCDVSANGNVMGQTLGLLIASLNDAQITNPLLWQPSTWYMSSVSSNWR